jgi:hypothetical protein
VKTPAVQGFSVERVTGIEPAWPAPGVIPPVAEWDRRGTYGPARAPWPTFQGHAEAVGA